MSVSISANDIVKEGQLIKQSRYRGVWRPRHFVLTQHYLCSFRTKGDYRNPTELIRLSDCKTVKSCEEEIGKENAFRLDSDGTVFYLLADSNSEKEAWIIHVGRSMIRHTMIVADDGYD